MRNRNSTLLAAAAGLVIAVASAVAMPMPAAFATGHAGPGWVPSGPPGPPHPPGPPLPPLPPGPPSPGAANGAAWAWTQLTSGGTRIRFVTTEVPANSCPTVRYTAGGARNPHVMGLVSGPMGAQFPTTVCQLSVPLGASNAVIERTTTNAATVHPANLQLPLPRWTAATRPRAIAVIGDTGCQVTALPATTQDCRNGWPFQPVADAAAATPQLDLTVHVGDYLYRDFPGNENDKVRNPGCTTDADRASWDCVVADFFRPAATLLAAAPVVLARGNHEDCNAAHQGGAGGAWFRYLANSLRADGLCFDYSNPVAINAGTLNFANLDSSFASDTTTPDLTQVPVYQAQFNQMNGFAAQRTGQDFFLVTHKPTWMVKAAGTAPGAVTWLTPTLDAALAGSGLQRLADNVRLVLSGHVHLFQLLDFNTSRPPQVTQGSSGGPLDNGPTDANVPGQPVGIPPQPVNQAVTQEQNPPANLLGVFGYSILRDSGGLWVLTFHQTNGAVRGPTCALSPSLTARSFHCT